MKKFTLDELIFFALALFAFSVIFSVTVVEGALLIALALLLVKKYQAKDLPSLKPALTGHPLFIPWLVYLGICLLTALTAYYPAKGLGQVNSDFLKYVCLSTLLLAVKKEHLPKLSAIYTAAAVIAAFIGIGEVARSIAANSLDITRANAFMNAVRYGEVMGIALLLILSRVIIPVKETFKYEKLFYRLAIFPVFIALVLSQTRGSYLGLFTGIAVMLYFASPSRRKVAAYAAILFVTASVVLLVNPSIRNRFTGDQALTEKNASQAAEPTYSSVNIRLELWKLGLTMFKDHPVLGVGPDNIKKVFKKYHPEAIGYNQTWGSLHNLYIHQAAERGIAGLGALLFLFLSLFLFSLNRFRAVRSPYTLWALCALPAYYMMNLTEITFQHVHTAFAIFLALAFAAVVEEEKL